MERCDTDATAEHIEDKASDAERPDDRPSRRASGPLVAVPLYRTPELLPDLIAALTAMADEIAAIDATILFIDDSPDDAPLRAALDVAIPALARRAPVGLIHNPRNLGFVRSANVALALARDAGRDVLLLNSDTLPRPGAFAEMIAVAALDPMIAVVSPRSDNATICNSPYVDAYRPADREAAYAAHRAIAQHLPRSTYVPTAVGFCLLIRHAMLAEFGLFDEIYGGGYNEENDFIRRCNQRGYRAVLANHAYVHHLGNVSFAQSGVAPSERESVNRAILLERYPEYDRAVTRWFDGAEYRAQRLVSGLVPNADGRLRLLFDCSTVKCFFNGTHEHICALLRAFARRHATRYDIVVLCDAEAFAFHGLDRVAGLRRCDAEEARADPSAMAVRLGQPFTETDMLPLADYAPLTSVLMFDTIAMDCQQLDDTDLETLWQGLVDAVDAIGFNSGFSRDQFVRRFDLPGAMVEYVSRCSTEASEYASPAPADVAGRGILLVGNHYPHKHVRETLEALDAAGADVPITVFGLEIEPRANVTGYRAGDLPQAQVDAFYDEARVVLFPSHYEGFGLPILHALARNRPVVARDLPCAREIRDNSRQGANLHLRGSTAELVALALDPPHWLEPEPRGTGPLADWGAAADAVADAVALAIARFDFARLRRRQARLVARVQAAGAPMPVAPVTIPHRPDLGLPMLGHGYMLGDHLDAAMKPVSARPQRFFGLPRKRRGGDERVGRTVALDYAMPGESAVAEAIQADVLTRLRGCAADAPVSLRLRGAGGNDTPLIRAFLYAAGCRGVTVEPVEGGLIARGSYGAAWTALLPGPADDADFVHHLYRQALGRNPDPEGGRIYLAELVSGRSREDMARLFLGSTERRDQIIARIVRNDRFAAG